MGLMNLFVRPGKTYQTWPLKRVLGRTRQGTDGCSQLLPGKVMTVGKLLSKIQSAPADSVLLGQCKDGLPFLMELAEPQVGSILIGCEPGCGRTHHLQVILDSAVRLHPADSLQISILTQNPGEWAYFLENNHYNNCLQAIHGWYDIGAEHVIQTLANLAETRREGEPSRPKALLLLDDLNFVEELGVEAQVSLRWLLDYGPQSNVWVTATIAASLAKKLGYWIEPFRTRLIGRVQGSQEAEILSNQKLEGFRSLDYGSFQVWTGCDWFTYYLPPLGD